MIKLYILLVFILVSFGIFGQDKNELEARRLNSLKEIEFTNKLIAETELNRKLSLNKLLLIESKISSRKDIIASYSEEIAYLNRSIEIHQEIVIGLENDLNTMKANYAKLIYNAYLHRGNYNKVMFLLASDDFNMAFKRLKYIQQYSKFRIEQAKQIEQTKLELGDKITALEQLKIEKSNLLVQEKGENQKLLVEKNRKDVEIQKLKSTEKELRAKLKKQNDIAMNLQKEIARIIAEEARLAAEKLKTNNKSFFQLTPEEALLADVFSSNKAKLPWPTERGVITGIFGEQPHPVLKGVKIKNDGVDIATVEGAPVRAVFDGTVSRVIYIPGAHTTIIIRHGNYLSVYSNLKSVTVKQGDKIKIKQVIGTIYTEDDKDHKSVLQFQIWKENEKMNPQEWLSKGANG